MRSTRTFALLALATLSSAVSVVACSSATSSNGGSDAGTDSSTAADAASADGSVPPGTDGGASDGSSAVDARTDGATSDAGTDASTLTDAHTDGAASDGGSGTDGASNPDGSNARPDVDLKVDGVDVTNVSIVAGGFAYSQEGDALVNVVRLRFDALGTTFDAELGIPKGTTANAKCFTRMGGGGTQFSSQRTNGSCKSTSTTDVELGDQPLTFAIDAVLSSAAAASPTYPAAAVKLPLTQRPDAGNGNLTNATVALTGNVTLRTSALNRVTATLGGTAKSYIGLTYLQDVGGGQTRPSVLGVKPIVGSGGAFDGYEFVQVLFVTALGTGGSCEANGDTVLFAGRTDATQVPDDVAVLDSRGDTAVNCSVTSTLSTTSLTGTFSGTVSGGQTSTVITNGTYSIHL